MTDRLKSHTHLFLREHIDQIKQAMEVIKTGHSNTTITPYLENLLEKSAVLHDLGKGTKAFQEYIVDPEHYHGEPIEKSHSMLSGFLALLASKADGWDEVGALLVLTVVLGHHSRLPTIPEYKIGGVRNPEKDVDNFTGGERARALKNQLKMLDIKTLITEIDSNFFCFNPNCNLFLDADRLVRELKRFLRNNLLSKFKNFNEEEAINFRLKAQLIFSILLEADKAFLAVSNPSVYVDKVTRHWKSEWVDKRIGIPEKTTANQTRNRIRTEIMSTINENERIFSLTAPTGSGKTLLAATWAIRMKEMMSEKSGVNPKIIIVLPFLSVIDQTAKEYSRLLEIGGIKADGTWLLTSHSLSDRCYSDDVGEEDKPFLVDTWRSELIITTYDQFLMSLIDPRAKYQMRFHNLCDAVIILDEVQSLPCKLWQPLEKIFISLTEMGNSRLLLMSATLPSFVRETSPLIKTYQKYFAEFKRYKICMKLDKELELKSFCEEVEHRLLGWLKEKRRVMITLNTRKSARRVMDALKDSWPAEYSDVPLYFISADVTPRDRLDKISKIKKGGSCIVVSTQCVEAGVDIDLDLVIRDFAPLDSIIQIAGRCNRESKLKKRGIVEIVDLVNENNDRYSEMIYDDVHLNITRDVLKGCTEILEENVLRYSNLFFDELSKKKDTGQVHLQRFVRWQEDLPVREILRGKETLQHTFLVLSQDTKLKKDMDTASLEKDRWKRREAWKKLAGRIALISVSIYTRPGFWPTQIADEYRNELFVLREGYYSSERGLLVEGETLIL